jgi:hypothetical protein
MYFPGGRPLRVAPFARQESWPAFSLAQPAEVTPPTRSLVPGGEGVFIPQSHVLSGERLQASAKSYQTSIVYLLSNFMPGFSRPQRC